MQLAHNYSDHSRITPSSVEAELRASEKFKILIVDDDPADQTLCSVLLRKINPGFHIQAEESGQVALDIIEQEEIHCVMLDYYLLDGQSDAIVEEIRKVKPWLPILVMSGVGNEEVAVRLMQLGASDYIGKDRLTLEALERCMTNAIIKCALAESLEVEKQELVIANAALLRQRREIESFYHTVSHELKTPITAVREFNSLLQDEILGSINEDQKEALATSIDCCDRLTRLVNDLFDTARIETGKLELHLTQVNVLDLLRQEVQIMQSVAREKDITLKFTHQSVVPTMLVDPDRINQVVCNLISNGIKYGRQGGYVDIALATANAGSQVVITVKDNGFGISAEHAEFIFDRLFQCEEPGDENVTSQNGMGIGLFLCRQIIDIHGGELGFESVLGQGSTFTVTLPVGAC